RPAVRREQAVHVRKSPVGVCDGCSHRRCRARLRRVPRRRRARPPPLPQGTRPGAELLLELGARPVRQCPPAGRFPERAHAVLRQLASLHILLPLLAVVLLGVAGWLVLQHIAYILLWSMFAFVPVFIAACEWWRRQIVRDEATRPFVTGPALELGSSPERKAIEGPRVLAIEPGEKIA